MQRVIHCRRFFATEEEAKTFQKEHGGVMYRNVPRSRTKQSYMTELWYGDEPAYWATEKPYCIAWNEIEK